MFIASAGTGAGAGAGTGIFKSNLGIFRSSSNTNTSSRSYERFVANLSVWSTINYQPGQQNAAFEVAEAFIVNMK